MKGHTTFVIVMIGSERNILLYKLVIDFYKSRDFNKRTFSLVFKILKRLFNDMWEIKHHIQKTIHG